MFTALRGRNPGRSRSRADLPAAGARILARARFGRVLRVVDNAAERGGHVSSLPIQRAGAFVEPRGLGVFIMDPQPSVRRGRGREASRFSNASRWTPNAHRNHTRTVRRVHDYELNSFTATGYNPKSHLDTWVSHKVLLCFQCGGWPSGRGFGDAGARNQDALLFAKNEIRGSCCLARNILLINRLRRCNRAERAN